MTTTLTPSTTTVPTTADAPTPVTWRVVSPVPGRVIVQVCRPGSIDHLLPQLRAGQLAAITTRVDAPREEIVAALGLSRQPWHPADLASVARAVLDGYDRAGTTGVRLAVLAAQAVQAGDATAPEQTRYRTVWPTEDHHRKCRAAVASLIRSTPWEVS